MDDDLLQRVLQSERFASMISEVTRRGIIEDLPAISHPAGAEPLDWNHLLYGASLVVGTNNEQAQQTALRIAQGCLTSLETTDTHRAAARVLLERMGNQPAIDLAEARDLLQGVSEADVSSPVRLDVVQARLALTIPAAQRSISGNVFQRQFWTAASQTQWISVSAATSAGKSFIIRQWLQNRMTESSAFRAVYLVPTRALIEEVGNELRGSFANDTGVYSFPWDPGIGSQSKEIFVLTQERFHLLQERLGDFVADLIFVDEAQKFGDDARGVLLQRALDDAVRRSANVQVLFASPLSENPGVLLEGAPANTTTSAISSETVTVLQNLLWVNQVPRYPRRWKVDLLNGEERVQLGEIELVARPSPESKRLPLVAVTLGVSAGSSIIYVNGAADAEKAALQVFDALGPSSDVTDSSDLAALIDLSSKTVHPDYALGSVLRRGVAFHYGNMPLLLRAEIERLFRIGTIRYLVCTSTLLEGVNLPCRNLFMRGPTRGRGRHLSAADFWNLAGRAGRWGKEFQGNIVCVDTDRSQQWESPPRRRVRYPLARATDAVILDAARLREYIASGTPVGEGQGTPPLESVFSFLAARMSAGVSMRSLPGMAILSDDIIDALESEIRSSLERVDVPAALISRHAGISPLSMQRLLDYFRGHEAKEGLALAPPESDDAVQTMVAAFARIDANLGQLGPERRRFMLALLVVDWMKGDALARIIAKRISYLQRNSRPYKLAQVIRECMTDVEQIARFEAPKFLSCYVDLLRFHYAEIGRTDDMAGLPDVAMLLELGVSRTTELSLMTLGLSRTTAIALSAYITDDELSPQGCVTWLHDQNLVQLDVPELVRREIATALERVAAPHSQVPPAS